MNLDWIAEALGARSVRRAQRIQSMWRGYGELFRITADGGSVTSAVVKWARPPAHAGDDAGTVRKLRSFAVEAAFYRTLAARCDRSCRVPALLASREAGGESVLVLEDLDAAGLDRRCDDANATQLDAVLGWLASFHARFIGERPAQLWPIGTYWHLETRRDELANIRDRALREEAPQLAAQLGGARFQTLLHGDAKDANFCFSASGTEVAAVDFQYVGPGPGVVDVMYLLHGRRDHSAALDAYFMKLRRALAPQIDAVALESEWRKLVPVAERDFERFLAGWSPARK